MQNYLQVELIIRTLKQTEVSKLGVDYRRIEHRRISQQIMEKGMIDYQKQVRVLHQIGKGCQAAVYAGENIRTGECYAIKTIMGQYGDCKEAQRIHFEIQSNYLLSHTLRSQYFPYFYGYWVEDNLVSLLFERCEGSAYAAIRHRRRPSQRYNFVFVLLYDMLVALSELQQKNIIHRDIKPQNILLKQGHFKLGDLGVSRIQAAHSLLTNDIGNQMTRSPQFYSGNYTCRTDVWSLAIAAFYILEQTIPFDSLTKSLISCRQQFIGRIRTKNFTVQIESDSFLHCILNSMLSIDPQQRPTASFILSSYFQQPSSCITDMSSLCRVLMCRYLRKRKQSIKSNLYLAVVLAAQDYHRYDDKMSSLPPAKRNICMHVKKYIYHVLNTILPLLHPEDIAEVIAQMLTRWQQQIQFVSANNVDVLAIKKVEDKFPFIAVCQALIREVQSGMQISQIYLWDINLKLKQII